MTAITGRISTKVLDANKVPVSIDFLVSIGTGLLADAQILADALNAALDGVTDGVIVQSTFTYDLALPAVKSAVLNAREASTTALLQFPTSTPNLLKSFDIPAMALAIEAPGTPNLIDKTNTAVTAFVSAVTTLVSGGRVLADRGGDYVEAPLGKAVKSTRKHRRALAKIR